MSESKADPALAVLQAVTRELYTSSKTADANALVGITARLLKQLLAAPEDPQRRRLNPESPLFKQHFSLPLASALLSALGFVPSSSSSSSVSSSSSSSSPSPSSSVDDDGFPLLVMTMECEQPANTTAFLRAALGHLEGLLLGQGQMSEGGGGGAAAAAERKEEGKSEEKAKTEDRDEAVAQLTEMGFSAEQAVNALEQVDGRFPLAVALLTRQDSGDNIHEAVRKIEEEESKARSAARQHQEEAAEAAVKRMLEEARRSGQKLTLEENNLRLLPEHKFGKTYSCAVCYDDYQVQDIVVLGCLHFLCRTCMGQHFSTRISEGKSTALNCAQCSYQVQLFEVEYCVSGAVLQKHQELLLQMHLRADPNCGWCPKPRCNTPMIASPDSPMMICPKCRTRFCFKCKTEEWHDGVSCLGYQRWREANANADSAFHKWVREHKTGRCPKCRAVFTKPSGCPSMRCALCHHSFTWVGAYDDG